MNWRPLGAAIRKNGVSESRAVPVDFVKDRLTIALNPNAPIERAVANRDAHFFLVRDAKFQGDRLMLPRVEPNTFLPLIEDATRIRPSQRPLHIER